MAIESMNQVSFVLNQLVLKFHAVTLYVTLFSSLILSFLSRMLLQDALVWVASTWVRSHSMHLCTNKYLRHVISIRDFYLGFITPWFSLRDLHLSFLGEPRRRRVSFPLLCGITQITQQVVFDMLIWALILFTMKCQWRWWWFDNNTWHLTVIDLSVRHGFKPCHIWQPLSSFSCKICHIVIFKPSFLVTKMGHQAVEVVGSKILCGHFHPPQMWVFQLGNAFILVSFFMVFFRESVHAILYERIVLSLGTLCLALWGWLVLPCQGDVVLWNLIFAVGHAFFANLFIWKAKPKVIEREKDEEKKAFYDRVNNLVKKLQSLEHKTISRTIAWNLANRVVKTKDRQSNCNFVLSETIWRKDTMKRNQQQLCICLLINNLKIKYC